MMLQGLLLPWAQVMVTSKEFKGGNVSATFEL